MMSDTKAVGWDHTEAEQAVKKAHEQKRQREQIFESLAEGLEDILGCARRQLSDEGMNPTEALYAVNNHVGSTAADLFKRGAAEVGILQDDPDAVDPLEGRTPMTDAQYVKESGSCPYCGSGEIEGGQVTIEGGGAWQEVSCTRCGKKWADSYMLTGYLGEKDDDHKIATRDKVTVEVTGGVAEVTACPAGVEVTIVDHDNEKAG